MQLFYTCANTRYHHIARTLVFVVTSWFFLQPVAAQKVTVTDVSPTAAVAGSTVTLTGANFSTNPGNNIVFFGSARGEVSSATGNTLKVIVPKGATYSRVSVTVSGLTAFTTSYFVLTFPGGHPRMAQNSFAKLATVTKNTYRHDNVTLADLTGDGLNDIITTSADRLKDRITLYRNTSTPGKISTSPPAYIIENTAGIAVADFDGDGKLDIAAASYTALSVFKNTGANNNLGVTLTYSYGAEAFALTTADINDDGLVDIIVLGLRQIKVFKNTSTSTEISFELANEYSLPFVDNTKTYYKALALGDMDGDGKTDIVALFNNSQRIGILRNSGTGNNVSFSDFSYFSTPAKSTNFGLADLNGDNLQDVFVYSDNDLSIFTNNSTPGNIALNLPTTTNFNQPGGTWKGVVAGDLNGDGKVDLVTAGSNSALDVCAKMITNTDATGNAADLFAFQRGTGATGSGPAIGDIDGDGKPDIVFITNGGVNVDNISAFINTDDAPATNTWTGVNNSRWNNTNNWSFLMVPAANENVQVSGKTHPLLIDTVAAANNFTIDAGVNVSITGNGSLALAGNIVNHGSFASHTGTLIMHGTTAQNITGGITIKNFTVNNHHGVNIHAGMVNVTGTYTPQAGILTTNGNLVLASNAGGTANIAAGNGDYIAGIVTVERHIPAKRAWRMLTAPVRHTGSIYANWQNNGAVTDTTGAVIFSPGGGGGLTPGGAETSIDQYDPAQDNWAALTNTENENLAGIEDVAANKVFRLYVTGPYGSNTVNNGEKATTLRATGPLLTGVQTFTFTGVPAKHFVPVGNPYASTVRLDSIHANATNTTGSFWVWDPERANTTAGGYVTFSYDPVTNELDSDIESDQTREKPFIQSGQGFLTQVKEDGLPTTITFKEHFKAGAANNTNGVFKPGGRRRGATAEMHITLEHNDIAGLMPEDEVLLKFDSLYSRGEEDDADKLFDFDENLALVVGNIYVDIERRPMPVAGDSVYMAVTNLALNHNYGFTFKPQAIALHHLKAYLLDRYLKTSTNINLTQNTTVLFATTGEAASALQNRFVLYFDKAGTLASSFTNIKAWQQQQNVQVQWTMAAEEGVLQYQAERSANGSSFTPVGATVLPRNSGTVQTYTVTDNSPLQGDNYYRIKAVNKDAAIVYGSTVKVILTGGQQGFTVYPNPLPQNGALHLRLHNIAAGKCAVIMYAINGQQMLQQNIQYDGTAATQSITLPHAIATGSYQVVLTDSEGKEWKQQVWVK